ncbi:Phosphotransacetylase [Corynebacterium pseudotuberculosis]|nr:Phosphotransacetylase [Corynebacterium pseudotuberculosis]
MTEIQHASVLLTRAGRNFDGFAVDAFADRLGLPVQQLVEKHADLAEILASKPLENRPGLFMGTGNVNFDARAASALGVPLLLLIDAPGMHVDLAAEECAELGVVLAAAFTAEEAETEAGMEKIRAGLNVETPVVMSAPVLNHGCSTKLRHSTLTSSCLRVMMIVFLRLRINCSLKTFVS